MNVSKFWSMVKKGRKCWIWTGANNGRYGHLLYGGRYVKAHVLAYTLSRRRATKKNVLHKCDTPLCVNPRHLFSGNQRVNLIDCRNKGRFGPARLTASIVRRIRKDYRSGLTQEAIAKTYCVTRSHIGRVLSGERWGDVK